MAFKRAEWHSGLTYQQSCETCKTNVRYTDYSLDFRPWYADGFVSCPNCKSPIRHDECYAIDENGNYINPIRVEACKSEEQSKAAFCSMCGNKFSESDLFCSKCGEKRR